MAKFAVGKNAYGICDRTGLRYKLNEMRVEWNGLKVGRDVWEPKHPQLEPRRKVVDAQALRHPRPDQAEGPSTQLLPVNPFFIEPSGVYSLTTIRVYHPAHGKTTGSTVVFSNAVGLGGIPSSFLNRADGHLITVIDSDHYTISDVSRINVFSVAAGLARAPFSSSLIDSKLTEIFDTNNIDGRKIGDITDDGSVTSADAAIMSDYANGVEITSAQKSYIETVMFPYFVTYSQTQPDYKFYWWDMERIANDVDRAQSFSQLDARALWVVRPVPNSIEPTRVVGHIYFGGAPSGVSFADVGSWRSLGTTGIPSYAIPNPNTLEEMYTFYTESLNYMTEEIGSYGSFLYKQIPESVFGGGSRVTVGA